MTEKLKNVLIVSQYFWPENFRVNELTEYLTNLGYNVAVITSTPNYPEGKVYEDFKKNPSRFSEYKGAQIVRVKQIPRGRNKLQLILNYFSFMFAVIFVNRQKLPLTKIDVVISFLPSPIFPAFSANVLKLRFGICKHFMWVLDLWPETPISLGHVQSPFVAMLLRKFISNIYKNADVIFAQSNSFIPLIKEKSPSGKCIEYLPSWVEDIYFTKVNKKSLKINEDPSRFTILYAGNIGYAQDFETLLTALGVVKKEVNLRMIFVGEGRAIEWLKKEVIQRELSKAVEFYPQQCIEKMPEIFAHADALYLSLRGKKVFEYTIPGKLPTYFAVGKPILASLSGEGAYHIKSSQSGFVSHPGCHQSLAANIKKLFLLEEEYKKKLGENGRKYCERVFVKEVVMKKLLKHLNCQ